MAESSLTWGPQPRSETKQAEDKEAGVLKLLGIQWPLGTSWSQNRGLQRPATSLGVGVGLWLSSGLSAWMVVLGERDSPCLFKLYLFTLENGYI